MKLGSAGLALLKRFEGCKLVAYQDQGGVWTIGYGHTGLDVHEGLVITQETADLWLQQDLQRTVLGVVKSLDIQLGQNAFDALVVFSYNVGLGNEAHSTLLKLVNATYYGAASAEFMKWDHIDGVENEGLKSRRAAERALFLTPDSPATAASSSP